MFDALRQPEGQEMAEVEGYIGSVLVGEKGYGGNIIYRYIHI